MSVSGKAVLVCSCNDTLKLDAGRLAASLASGAGVSVSRELCRHDNRRFLEQLGRPGDVLVACTQEAPLFRDQAREAGHAGELRFANIRELAGWSRQGAEAQPKIAALLALASLPEPEPVPAVSYRSAGATLIVGPLDAALAWAEQLKDQLDVSVLATSARGELPLRRDYPVFSGAGVRVRGHAGSFEAEWEQDNPIDLDLCVRCNACVRACPEQAITASLQVDLDRCRSHRACVAACGSVGAIDFERSRRSRSERYDLVLDLSATPLIRLPHPPQGYLAPGRDVLDQARAALELTRFVGEFEKPVYTRYKASICAHGRNAIEGCTRCLDVCSAAAIRADGDHVKVDEHLCLGCGGCATVCPSGALRHVYPAAADWGARLKAVLGAYAAAGGADAVLLFHKAGAGEDLLMELGRRGAGLPAAVIPLPVHDIASVGLDLLLAAMAYGAAACAILSQGDEPEAYREASRAQLEIGNLILAALGYEGRRLRLIEAADWQALETEAWRLPAGTGVTKPAGFNLSEAKRTNLEFAIDHLAKQAPRRASLVPLPAGAPFGTVHLDKARCTLCMSCVGACPASALMDAPDAPRLKFVERNCVQCGLCVKTCPENALALEARLLLTDEVRRERVLNEAEPFHCVRCGKAFGTRQMIDHMSGRLAAHSMFGSAEALRRLQMCADCRVVDMMDNRNETSIFDLSR